MGQLGDLFPGAKIRKDTPEEAGNGQRFEPGPLDLDSGVIRLRPTRPASPAEETDDGEN
ncbi:MAG TPA: hypothetical protein VFX16_01835 [Pseudonocardiaceae bacterium]|nr:hypothetical protein [Pseudonocardiaceae bacterium]